MLKLRRSAERGHFDHGWLDTYHTFSFGDYYDPEKMGFRSLRVINEDRVAPGTGFGMHGHRDMEIVTYVLAGALEHKDSMGNGETLRPGELQRMSAGMGIRHSEFNPSPTEPVHLYQIWLLPKTKGIAPSYEQKKFDDEGKRGRWQLVASPDGAAGSLAIHQDATIELAALVPGQSLARSLAPGHHAWLQVLRGSITLTTAGGGKETLTAGDAAAIADEPSFTAAAAEQAELMLFDLA